MEWEVQSELVWFRGRGMQRETLFFRVIPEIKKKIKKSQTPVCGSSARIHPSSVRREARVERLAPRKINRSLKEPFQTERYGGRLAPRH